MVSGVFKLRYVEHLVRKLSVKIFKCLCIRENERLRKNTQDYLVE